MSRAILTGVFLLTLVLSGCAALNNLLDLGDAIEDAGYHSVSCNSNSVNGHTILDINANTTTDEPTNNDAPRIAKIVWTTYDGTFDELRITINGTPSLDATTDELTDMFGNRPEGVVSNTGSNFTMVIILTLVAAAILIGLVILIWWRGRKPPPPVAPPPYYQYPPQQYPPTQPPPQQH